MDEHLQKQIEFFVKEHGIINLKIGDKYYHADIEEIDCKFKLIIFAFLDIEKAKWVSE